MACSPHFRALKQEQALIDAAIQVSLTEGGGVAAGKTASRPASAAAAKRVKFAGLNSFDEGLPGRSRGTCYSTTGHVYCWGQTPLWPSFDFNEAVSYVYEGGRGDVQFLSQDVVATSFCTPAPEWADIARKGTCFMVAFTHRLSSKGRKT